ncbi:MAG: hypothetical protein M0P91_05560 [Sulfuricurvum sp.]|jgi:hypothetical protein|uniref:hypothetical protein n=1 Tax=Sulfuricurvum sp. TaxID=2025608 RepID=UPI0025D1BDFC|nr:hypothetical protein [Sulfuricurvum sp.]MCK9372644.1 hypothetical protein [Sulfuricurvum sp.]
MRVFVYTTLFLLTLIVFKAFYWDADKINLSQNEENISVESVPSEPFVMAPQEAVSQEKNESNGSKGSQSTPSNKNMPLERLGDAIADKLQKRITPQ